MQKKEGLIKGVKGLGITLLFAVLFVSAKGQMKYEHGYFLFEHFDYVVSDVIIRPSGFVHYKKNIVNSYKDGVYFLIDGIEYLSNKINNPKLDTNSVMNAYNECREIVMNSDYNKFNDDCTAYDKIYMNIVSVYAGDFSIPVPNFKKEKGIHHTLQKTPIYIVIKINKFKFL